MLYNIQLCKEPHPEPGCEEDSECEGIDMPVEAPFSWASGLHCSFLLCCLD